MKRKEIKENGINLVWEITEENEIKLLHFSALDFDERCMVSDTGTQSFYPVEILASGQDRVGAVSYTHLNKRCSLTIPIRKKNMKKTWELIWNL